MTRLFKSVFLPPVVKAFGKREDSDARRAMESLRISQVGVSVRNAWSRIRPGWMA